MSLKAGELVGLIGPNGCGKSTLLRCLSRILPTATGTVQLDGRDLKDWSPRELARQIAFVPQIEGALFEFTVHDLVLMGRHAHLEPWKGETDADYRIVKESLAEADILHLAERKVTELSGGEHRRVLVARALAQRAPLLLLDEPTAHLDVAHRTELMSLLQRQARTGRQGVIAALHDLNEAAEFCDRLVLMFRGRIVADGVPDVVLTSSNLRTAYSAESQIGSNPITGRPMLLAVLSGSAVDGNGTGARVHVICGGGTGLGTMGALVRAGYQVTAGVLNELDSDQFAADALGIPTVKEAPFSPIGSDARQALSELMAQASYVVITPVPFGNGNLANLKVAAEAQQKGIGVVILGEGDLPDRDYASGSAAKLFDELISKGADRHADVEAWLAARALAK